MSRDRKDSVISQTHSMTPPCTPHILVSEASVTDFKELLLSATPRRASSQSMGAVIVSFYCIVAVIVSCYCIVDGYCKLLL